MADDNNVEPSIEELQKRYKSLETKKITAEANLRTSNQRLEDLKKQARQKYGADDLDILIRDYPESARQIMHMMIERLSDKGDNEGDNGG